jgi:hypothetical protein
MYPEIRMQPGGVVAFSGRYLASWGINLVTYGVPGWSASHVGIIGIDGHTLFEATAQKGVACRPMYPVNYKGRAWYYELVKPLNLGQWNELDTYLNRQLGLPYDARGAARAGLKGFSWLMSKVRAESDDKMFCSEYVARALYRIGVFNPHENTSRWSPNALLREGNRQGIFKDRIRIQ